MKEPSQLSTVPKAPAPGDLTHIKMNDDEASLVNELGSQMIAAQARVEVIVQAAHAQAQAQVAMAQAALVGALKAFVKQRRLEGDWGIDPKRPGFLIKAEDKKE